MGSLDDEIMIRLQVDPEFRGGVERLGKKPGGFRVTPRFPRTISLIRWTGTPRCFARAT